MNTPTPVARRGGAALIVVMMAAAVLVVSGTVAQAAIVPTVPLGTAANYSVLGAETVTNTGGTTLANSLGLWPGTSITGFPPGQVLPPATTDITNAAAQQAQSDLTVGYLNAAGRPLDATTTADLTSLRLPGGVYAGPNKSPLSLNGPLVLDGEGNANSVFIFQTDSTLTTGPASTVTLINGAQECNVFWQVGSSATLGSASVFAGNILALISITVDNGVTVHGRALAREGEVTLINDTFTTPTCALSSVTDTTGGAVTTTTGAATTATTTSAGGTTGGGTTGGVTTTTAAAATTTDSTAPGETTSRRTSRTRTSISRSSGRPGVPAVVGPPRTGGAPLGGGSLLGEPLVIAFLLGGAGTLATGVSLRARRSRRASALER